MSVPSAIATPIAVAATPRASRARGGVVQGRIAPNPAARRAAGRTDAAVASLMAARAVATGPDGYSADGLGCAELDEQLYEHEGHLKYRWEKFLERKAAIADAEGSLAEFAKGYTKFGFNKTASGEIVFREWARPGVPRCPHRRLQRLEPGRHAPREGRLRGVVPDAARGCHRARLEGQDPHEEGRRRVGRPRAGVDQDVLQPGRDGRRVRRHLLGPPRG